jgi:type II secretory pathway pseudopilin PulG
LTIVEMLIALSLLGVMVSMIVSSLVGSFALTRDSRKTLDATSNAQRILEEIRGQWSKLELYNAGCIEEVKFDPTDAEYMDFAVTTQQLSATTELTADDVSLLADEREGPQVVSVGACTPVRLPPEQVCISPLRRVTVTVFNPRENNRPLAALDVDVICPGL